MKQSKEMKRYMTKYLALTGGLLMLGSLSGCQLEDPEIPAEELYIRGFIKQYGLIDPTQDFSSAMQTNITLNIPGTASVVNVYAKMGEDLYRVGCFADLQGTVSLPVDVSEATETVVLDIDGVRYYTTPGGTVNVKSGSKARSRAADDPVIDDNFNVLGLWIDPAKWATVTAANGETGDTYGARKMICIGKDGKITSNDQMPSSSNDGINSTVNYPIETNGSVISITDGDVTTNYFNVATAGHIGSNQTGDGTHHVTLGDNKSATNPGEIGHTYNGSNVSFLIKNNDNALAAYRFVFRTASKNDANIRVVLLGQQTMEGNTTGSIYKFMDSGRLQVDEEFIYKETLRTDEEGRYTEWELRTDMLPRGYYELIILGLDSKPNADLDQSCGNWGFLRMERIKTAKDMRWILACEDLGTTDDFDFNDVVFSIEAVNTNTAAIRLGVVQWQVVDNPDEGITIHPEENSSKAPASRDGEATTVPGSSDYKTRVKVKALAAGGTLPIWLHYREENDDATGTDYIVCPSKSDGKRGCLVELTSTYAADEAKREAAGYGVESCSEWHRWFGESSHRNMLNTGMSPHINDTRSVTFYTKNVFTLENFCYLKFVSTDNSELPYYFHEGQNMDPWTQKVLQWQWQQSHSQEVTFGFFLTVYEPTVKASGDYINANDPKTNTSHIISRSLDGLPPQMFLIPDCNSMPTTGYAGQDFGWCWPCERVDITKVYPNFKVWCENATGYYGINWFMLPKSGDVLYQLYPRNPDDLKGFVYNPPPEPETK